MSAALVVTEQIKVEVVFATAKRQSLLELEVAAGSTVAEVIARSGIAERFRGERIDDLAVGIWGRVVDREQRVRPGDRVEVYRPLAIDPRQARRQLAEAGRTMGRRGKADADS